MAIGQWCLLQSAAAERPGSDGTGPSVRRRAHRSRQVSRRTGQRTAAGHSGVPGSPVTCHESLPLQWRPVERRRSPQPGHSAASSVWRCCAGYVLWSAAELRHNAPARPELSSRKSQHTSQNGSTPGKRHESGVRGAAVPGLLLCR